MKRLVIVAILGALLTIPVFADASQSNVGGKKDAGAATLLSLVFAGSGEWYNNDFKGDFPWSECILGEICCLVKISSAFDAAAGNTEKDIRLDFWSNPK